MGEITFSMRGKRDMFNYKIYKGMQEVDKADCRRFDSETFADEWIAKRKYVARSIYLKQINFIVNRSR